MEQFIQESLIAKNGPLANTIIKSFQPVSGGCIHNAWKLALNDGREVFAKTATTSQSLAMLQFEAESLQALSAFADKALIEIPTPIAITEINGTCVLILPWLNLCTGDQRQLGRGLALLHKSSANTNQESFGWEVDGFIGLGTQPKGWHKKWGECFTQLRLKPQIKMAQMWDSRFGELNHLLDKINNFLEIHQPTPSIVHGDLWSGNAAMLNDGRGVLIDPACWWADREVDLAMTRLFGGFSKDFYEGYESIWPLPKCSNQRIEIYNLYHLLNHANLFGGSYQNQCRSSIQNIMSILVV